MEILLDNLIELLIEAKKKTQPNGSATIYIGHPDGSGADEDNLCLCAEEIHNGTNIPLFKIRVHDKDMESCVGSLMVSESLDTDIKAANNEG